MNLREALAFLVWREIARATRCVSRCRASWRSSRSCGSWIGSTSRHSHHSIRARSGNLRHAAVSLMATWSCNSGHPEQARTDVTVCFGREAIRQNYNVQFLTAPTLVAMLAKAHSDGWAFEANAAHLFFQLVFRRYEKGSILITLNRSVGERGSVFGDPVVATAILDRLLHHSTVMTIRGYSTGPEQPSGCYYAPSGSSLRSGEWAGK
ncbi:Probable insertion sequence ATP-binding protein, IS21 family [Neorhizobium galegae bv. orientalis]|nr:Probable insertion sequence ATP-binding protein, IS21 family [Neorhizobium galegae bv. orientalis]